MGTFAVGFFARPVGGLTFGHYGDRLGRKAMLIVSLLMRIATSDGGTTGVGPRWVFPRGSY
jgi:MFS family permease